MADTPHVALDTPRVSVVMPVFNGEAYLAEAVESVLGQTMGDLELLAVDDGSEDASRAILEQFAREDPRIRLVVNEKNLGVSAALNHGWHLAQAPYIAIAHADDIALPDRLSRQVQFLDAHPSIAVVGGAVVPIDVAGRRGSIMRYPTSSRGIGLTLLRRNCLAHPSVMLRRSALEEVGGYRLDYIEDYDLWLRISERFELANLPEPLVLYRLHPRQISVVGLEELVKRRLAVCAAARTRRATGDDPLAGVEELTPEILDRLGIDEAQLGRAVTQAWLAWAAILADLDCREESEELVAQASRILGPRAAKAFAAATELQQAETLLGAGRPLAGVAHVLLAFRREPRYASERLAVWLGDRLHRIGLLKWM